MDTINKKNLRTQAAKILSLFLLFCYSFSALAASCDQAPVLIANDHQGSATSSKKMLNSELIEKKFGSYGVEVLASSTAEVRYSTLYSVHDSQRICRTFAITQMPKFIDPAFAKEHALIIQGSSIGATFKAQGWDIQKTTISSSIGFPIHERIYTLMHLPNKCPLVQTTYQLVVSKDGISFIYATITEWHHPEHISEVV